MKLHSNVLGNGLPLIILHGFLGMGDNWKTLGKKYSEIGYQVHLIDQRNHGRSPHSDDFSYSFLSDDLLEYCNDNNLSKINLLGHSMGGKTAMHFACEHPNKIDHLIIADIAPKYYAPHHQDILDSLLALDFSEIKSRSEAEDELRKYIKDPGTRMFLLKNIYRKTPSEFDLRINLKTLSNKVIEIGQPLGANCKFNGKTLFLRGDKSNYIPENEFENIANHFPNYSIKTIKNAGHWLHAENPTDFLNITSNFLKTN